MGASAQRFDVQVSGKSTASSLPALDVAVNFRPGSRVDKKNRKRIAVGLVDAVSNHVPAPSKQVQILNTWRRPLPECVAFIHLHRSERLSGHVWSALDGKMSKAACHAEIQGRMPAKERKLGKCLQGCSRCWLVVVATRTESSSFFEPDDRTTVTAYHSGYDRVFFLDAFSNRYFELVLQSR